MQRNLLARATPCKHLLRLNKFQVFAAARHCATEPPRRPPPPMPEGSVRSREFGRPSDEKIKEYQQELEREAAANAPLEIPEPPTGGQQKTTASPSPPPPPPSAAANPSSFPPPAADEASSQPSSFAQRRPDESVSQGAAGQESPNYLSSLGTTNVDMSGDESTIGQHVGPDGQYNPWAVLGLKPGAPMNDIRTRYHELMKEYHPDFVESGPGDVLKFNEVDKAFQIITKAPTLDSRYRNLVSDTEYFYYRFLPQWMAKNLDEMPRYYSWLRFRLTPFHFSWTVLLVAFIVGRVATVYPYEVFMLTLVFLVDCLLHTQLAPIVFVIMNIKAMFGRMSYDLGWFQSPKIFLRRPMEL